MFEELDSVGAELALFKAECHVSFFKVLRLLVLSRVLLGGSGSCSVGISLSLS